MAQNLTTLAPKTPTTFKGITGGLVGAAQQGSPQAQQYTAQTAQYGAGNLPIGSEAADIAKQYGQKIADVGQQGAAFRSGQLTTGTSPVAEGNAAVTAQNTAAQQQALATGEEAALQGTGQQLTAQQQAANAANQAAGQAYTGQGQKISGLTSAAGLAAPQLGSIAQIPFSPLSQEQGAPLGSNSPGGILGAARLAGQVQGAQAEGAAPGLGAAAGTQAVAAAPGQTQASNIRTGGTSVVDANATGLAQSIQNETQLNTAATQAQTLASQVQEAMQNSGLNLTNSTDANMAINNLQSRLGNAAYTQLNIAVNDARNAYQAILVSTGATPTDAGAAANQNINANMSPTQILAAIDQLNQGVNARLQAAHQQTQQFQSQLQGTGTSSAAPGTSGGTSTSGFGWNG